MKLLDRALDLLFPPKCPFCQTVLEEPGDPVCPACQKSLPWLLGRAGERKVDFTRGCCSPLAYGGAVREAVHRYKFSGVRAYARPFGLLMAQCVQDRPEIIPDVVTSGATLSECARTLLEAGAAEVWCVTLAQARPS